MGYFLNGIEDQPYEALESARDHIADATADCNYEMEKLDGD